MKYCRRNSFTSFVNREILHYLCIREDKRAARNIGRHLHLFVNYEFIFGDDRLYRNVLLYQNLCTECEAERNRLLR